MKTVRFDIPGPVKGKARPRVTRAGITYTPKDTVQYENLVKLCYREACEKDHGGTVYFDGPVSAMIRIYYDIPKSMSKKDKALALLGCKKPMKKPDLDNVLKIILDSLNAIAYRDDSQVTIAMISKAYAETPHVDVTLGEVAEDAHNS